MKTFTVHHFPVIDGVQKHFARDEDRIQAEDCDHAEQLFKDRFGDDPEYYLYGELNDEEPYKTILDHEK